MRKLAADQGIVEIASGRVPDAVVLEETLTNVVVLEDERLTAARVASPHLADPRQAKDFQLEVIEDTPEAGV